jgi:phosphoribosyl-ATP pyrophosphohydrolase/phosphoribosyl-AMP cyclohydrolase
MSIMSEVKFDEKGLVPAIAQDYRTKQVLMMAYMNKESLEKTLETGKATYFSRSRGKLWTKGEESGHFQYVKDMYIDCDGDTLLLEVEQVEAACHTGNYSCFYRKAEEDSLVEVDTFERPVNDILYELYDVICDRIDNPKEGSYTNYLFEKGIDKILKKVGEEACEVIIAAKGGDKDAVRYEVADLLFHLWVMLRQTEIEPDDIFYELKFRR